MERCKKSLVPTEKGLALNSVVKKMRIADVAMTGEREKELARIEPVSYTHLDVYKRQPHSTEKSTKQFQRCKMVH